MNSHDFYLLAVQKQQAADMLGAYQAYLSCVRTEPPHAAGWNNLGVMLKESQRSHAALAAFRRAVTIEPKNAHYLSNLGDLCWETENYTEAEKWLKAAVKADATCAVAWFDLALVYMNTSRLEQALNAVERACKLEQRIDYLWGRAFILLFSGNYVDGWKEYDHRIQYRLPQLLTLPYPMWKGENLDDKVLYVYHEQGLGDSLMWLRFIPALAKTYPALKIILDMPPEIMRLARKNLRKYVWKLRAVGNEMPSCDYHMPLTSIAGRLGISDPLNFIHDDYLQSPDGAPELPQSKGKLKVGLCWAGNAAHIRDTNRSLSLDIMLDNFILPDVELYSLQIGPRAEDIVQGGAQGLIHDLSPLIRDLADTCSLCRQLDLVITVDTVVAHAAGAVGTETLLLLPRHGCDWRWGSTGYSTHWYPSLRLLRQDKFADWSAPLRRAVKIVEGLS